MQAMTTASRTSDRPTGRLNLQSCLYFHRYGPRTLWDLMGDNQVGMDKVIQEVGDLLGALGFVNLNEQSFVHVVAMLTLARHGNQNFRVQVSGCWQLLNQLKSYVRAIRGRVRMPHYNVHTAMPNYPAEFQAAHPGIFANADPRLPDGGGAC